MKDLFSNIVDQKNLRNVQDMTLTKISETLSHTAGPYGSNTIILGDPGKGKPDTYTKDGHKVLSHIDFFNPLEKSIQTQLMEITEHIVKTVGDGTTSTVMMCASIFHELNNYLNDHPNIPVFKVVDAFDKCVSDIQAIIKSHGRDIEPVDIFDICMISTNGNAEIATQIADIYNEFGMEVFINVQTSNEENHIIKSYDGLTLERGYSSPAFINQPNDENQGLCIINKPRIYTFVDPVDTPEMIEYFKEIVVHNIMKPIYLNEIKDIVPTVIMAPNISRDANSFLQELEKLMYSMDPSNKAPMLIISGLNKDIDQYNDIIMLCGDKMIRKYIDPKVQKKDIEDGKAPSIDNIWDWYGECDQIICDNMKTKFINPKDMYVENEDGERVYSPVYNGLLKFIEQELEMSIKNSEGIGTIANLKRRLNSLKANLVDFFIGGISTIDRDSVKDLVEDAVLNCRSACRNGVGYGSNFEGLRAIYELSVLPSSMNVNKCSLYDDMLNIILSAYRNVITNLYELNYDGDVDELIDANLRNGKPINLRTRSYEGEQVLCSIDSDITILDCIKKVIVPMATANQALLINVQHNKYLE